MRRLLAILSVLGASLVLFADAGCSSKKDAPAEGKDRPTFKELPAPGTGGTAPKPGGSNVGPKVQ